MKKLTTMLHILARVAAVAMVILPCIQNVVANILVNKKRNFIIEHTENMFSSVITAAIKKYTHCVFLI